MNDISKHFNITLDIKQSKLLKPNISVNYGDDVTFNIAVLENNEPKNLTDCKVDFMVANENPELNAILHRFEMNGISILNNVVTIVCKSNYIDRLGGNFGQLFIYDQDQTISTQQFLFITNSTLSSDIIEDANEKIDTLIKLDEAIADTTKDLADINASNTALTNAINTNLTNMTNKVNSEIERATEVVNTHTTALDKEVTEFEEDINSRIGAIKNTVDYELIKINKLKPITISGSTNIGFETKVIDVPAIELVKSAYDFMVCGSCSSQQIIQAATGHIVFYVEVVNSIQVAKARLSTIIDQSIQGKILSPSIQFMKNGQLVDSLDTADTGYKIIIKCNIHQNNIATAECSLSSLARNINL